LRGSGTPAAVCFGSGFVCAFVSFLAFGFALAGSRVGFSAGFFCVTGFDAGAPIAAFASGNVAIAAA
jgi:hypothetical protein